MATMAMETASTPAMATAMKWRAMKRAIARAARAMIMAMKKTMSVAARAIAMATKRAMATDGDGKFVATV